MVHNSKQLPVKTRMGLLQLKLPSYRHQVRLERKLQVQRHILRTSMPRPNMKNVSVKRLGINSNVKWNLWVYLNKKKRLLNKRSCIKKARIIVCSVLRFLYMISSLVRLLEEVPLVKLEYAEIEKLTR